MYEPSLRRGLASAHGGNPRFNPDNNPRPSQGGVKLGWTGMATEETRIVLRAPTAAGDPGNPVVDHPGSLWTTYVHTDGTVWTWQAKRCRPLGASAHLRVYDLVMPSSDSPPR